MKLQEVAGTYSIVRLSADSPIPDWVKKSGIFWIGKTPDELSIVCETSVIPDVDCKRENDWKCLQVVGPLDFSLTGILHSITAPLAAVKISIFALSTFNTDYFLVREAQFPDAVAALKKASFDVS